MTRTVELTGCIPVTVTVDLDDRAVTAVRAWDQEFRYGDPLSALRAWRPANSRERQAQQIADTNLWPAWEWGG